jgi:ABC-type bacteriocin/lantibiotic exporter with double-glycine peptidase domain
MLLSNFAHRRQRRESDCLVACAQMALDQLGIQFDYPRLAKLLRAGEQFTPFSNLHFLETLGLSVTLGYGDATIFASYIEVGLPVLASVKTVDWKHWRDEIAEHAVVVVGIDESRQVIYLNDPFFSEAPIEMSLIAFEIGWEEKDRQYAVIGLAPP